MRMYVRWWAVLCVFALALVAAPALAQSTGGSFGGGGFNRRSGSSGSSGGSWGGGGSSSGSSWGSSGSSGSSWGSGSRRSSSSSWGNSGSSGSSWGNSGSSSSSPGSYSGGSGGGCGVGLGGLCCLLVIGGVFALVIFTRKKPTGSGPNASLGSGPMGSGVGAPSYFGPDAMHVSQLSIGVDWRARRQLQETLTRLAQTGDTQSPQGLANLLRETVLALRRAELSWLYVAQKTLGPFSPQVAEQHFNQLTTGARAAFQHELVRGAGGQVATMNAPEMRANANEGEGTVVVHLIIAAYRPLAALQSPDANQLRMALDNRAALTADQLAVLEVVWSPAAENDRMSTAELEQFYPDMRLIDPNSIAGRIFCTYCRGPFAMELLTCPHCGAPAEASQNNRSPR